MNCCQFKLIGDCYVCLKCGTAYPCHMGGGLKVECVANSQRTPLELQVKPLRTNGPGTHLHTLIKKWTGEDYDADCPCRFMATQMNAWGPDGCREHLEEIVDKMVQTAEKRKWEFTIPEDAPYQLGKLDRLLSLPGVRRGKKWAIKMVGREAARWLVLMAIDEAEQESQNLELEKESIQ